MTDLLFLEKFYTENRKSTFFENERIKFLKIILLFMNKNMADIMHIIYVLKLLIKFYREINC